MLRGKIINSTNQTTVIHETKTDLSGLLVSSKQINSCVYKQETPIKKNVPTVPTVPTVPNNQNVILSKLISNNTQPEPYKTAEFVDVNKKNIRYSLNFISTKFPGYGNLYYMELYNILMSTDLEINNSNLSQNLNKFINLGNNTQRQISRLNNILSVKSTSYQSIKEKISDKIGMFTSDSDIILLFKEFSIDIKNLYVVIYKEYIEIKNIDFSKYKLIFLYFEFLKFLAEELTNKGLASDRDISTTVISSRIISLNSSIIILEQFKSIIDIEINSIELEINNIENYLNILQPSLELLEHQNIKDFKTQFKKFIK